MDWGEKMSGTVKRGRRKELPARKKGFADKAGTRHGMGGRGKRTDLGIDSGGKLSYNRAERRVSLSSAVKLLGATVGWGT